MKGLLRRRYFRIANVIYILINLGLIVDVALIERYNLLIKILSGGFSVCVSVLIFLLCIRGISIEHMMYATYLGVFNGGILLFKSFFSFLIYFQGNSPYEIIFESIPLFIVSGISVLYSFYIACIRKCIVDGLVYPVFIQRRKRIESRIVLVRREYPEIFSVQ